MTVDAQSTVTRHAGQTSHATIRPNMHSTVAIRTTTADPGQSSREMADYAKVNLDMGSLKSRLKQGMRRKATEPTVKVIAHSKSFTPDE